MKYILIITFIFLAQLSFSQKQIFPTVKNDTAYQWYNSTKAELDSFYYDLQPIKGSVYKVHYRMHFPGQIVDLFSDDNNSFSGILTNFITEYPKENSKAKSSDYKEIYQKVQLDSSTCIKVSKVISTNMISIPTDSLIPNWNSRFLHCHNSLFQYKIGHRFNSTSFHCISGQPDTVLHVSTLLRVHDLIYDSFDLETK